MWDSHPLSLGATPKQVYIDGIAQIENPHASTKPPAAQKVPKTPDFSKEVEETIKYEGLPPLEAKKATAGVVIFTDVRNIYLRQGSKIQEIVSSSEADKGNVVVVENGQISCMGSFAECPSAQSDSFQKIDLEGGSIL